MVLDGDQKNDTTQSFLRAARAGHLDKVMEHLANKMDPSSANANGLTALHLAAKEGHVSIVNELINRGVRVDLATKKGNTSLHIACLAGKLEIVKILLEVDADVNAQSQNGFTPLYMAAQENHSELVSYLLVHGANQAITTQDGFTPLAVALQQGHDKIVSLLLENDSRSKVRLPALHIAAKKDDVNAANLLLNNETNVDHQSNRGFTPLHITAHYGNENTAILLINRGANVNFQAKNNITPLHVAAQWGRLNMVKLLIESGAVVDCQTRDGLTPLHCAARSGQAQVAELLIQSGANYAAVTKNGLTPLHVATHNDHEEVIRLLIAFGANVNETTSDYLTALHVAAHCGNYKSAKALLDNGTDPNSRALNGFTPLHIACKKHKLNVVELLLQCGAMIDATTETGLTALHVAAFVGSKDIVVLLLQRGATVDQTTMRCETPLHLAVRTEQIEVVKLLIRNAAKVDAKTKENTTPLHIAVRTGTGNLDMVRLLLDSGANPNTATRDNYTALHLASKGGKEEMAALLLEHGADVDAGTKKGLTPLHIAAKYGQLALARHLIKCGAHINSSAINGLSPLHLSTHNGHLKVTQLLLDHGADPHQQAKNGFTALHIAATKHHQDIATLLLLHESDPNTESRNGFTPLHLATQEGHTDLVSLFLQNKADANAATKVGFASLHLAAHEDRVPVAEILIQDGADLNAVNNSGYTAVHMAAHYGQMNILRYLLSLSAPINPRTALGFTPLHLAAQQGHLQVVYLLLENGADANILNEQGYTAAHIARKQHYLNIFEVLKRITTVVSSWEEIEEETIILERPERPEHGGWDSDEEGSASPFTPRLHRGRDQSSLLSPNSSFRSGVGSLFEKTGASNDDLWHQMEYSYETIDSRKPGPRSWGGDSLRSYQSPESVGGEDSYSDTRMHTDISQDFVTPVHGANQFSSILGSTDWDFVPENLPITRRPISTGFLVSFMVDARGGTMQAQRHPLMRILIPPSAASSPTRITCRLMRLERVHNPPPFNDGEGLASRVLEMGPSSAQFNSPILLEIPHYASLRDRDREVIILRSDNGETWKEHHFEATEQSVHDSIGICFDGLLTNDEARKQNIIRILTKDFPLYFALITRIRQESALIGGDGGVLSSTVVPQVQAVFPSKALQKKIKVGLQAHVISSELLTKVAGPRVAVSPIVTIEPRRRKFHLPITMTMPCPLPTSRGKTNATSGTNLRLLCSITGGTEPATWEDITGSSALKVHNDVVSFTTTVSARLWLMQCPDDTEVVELAGHVYKEAMVVPYIGSFVVYARRHEEEEAVLRCLCLTDDNADKTLECQENFELVARGPLVEVLNDRHHFVETGGNLVPVVKSNDQPKLLVRAFHENRLSYRVRVRDCLTDATGKVAFLYEGQSSEQPLRPITTLEVKLPNDIRGNRLSMISTASSHGRTAQQPLPGELECCHADELAKSDLDLREVSNAIGGDWETLSPHLNLSKDEMDNIRENYRSDEERSFQCLCLWYEKEGANATGNNLAQELRSIGREDVVKSCMHNVSYVTSEKEREKALKVLATKDVCEHHQPDTSVEESGAAPSVDFSMLVEEGTSDASDRVKEVEELSQEISEIAENDERDDLIVPEIDPAHEMNLVEETAEAREAKAKAMAEIIDRLNEFYPEPEIPSPGSPSQDEASEESFQSEYVEKNLSALVSSALEKDSDSKVPVNLTILEDSITKDDKSESAIMTLSTDEIGETQQDNLGKPARAKFENVKCENIDEMEDDSSNLSPTDVYYKFAIRSQGSKELVDKNIPFHFQTVESRDATQELNLPDERHEDVAPLESFSSSGVKALYQESARELSFPDIRRESIDILNTQETFQTVESRDATQELNLPDERHEDVAPLESFGSSGVKALYQENARELSFPDIRRESIDILNTQETFQTVESRDATQVHQSSQLVKLDMDKFCSVPLNPEKTQKTTKDLDAQISETSSVDDILESNLLTTQHDLENDDEEILASAYDKALLLHSSPMLDEESNRSSKHSGVITRHEVIESKPDENTEIEEDETVLPDGTVVKRRVMRTKVQQTVTEKDSKEFCGSHMEDSSSTMDAATHEIIRDSPEQIVETKEIEEIQEDGSIVRKIITTKRITERVTERIVTDETLDDSCSCCSQSDAESCCSEISPNAEGSAVLKNETETLPDGSVITRTVRFESCDENPVADSGEKED